MSASLRSVSFALVVLTPLVAAAQEGRDTTTLRPVVITATRSAEDRAAIPATVTVLDGATLRESGITRVSEALRSVPGLTLVQSGSLGGATSIFMRGANSNSTKVLVDGIAINAPGGAIDLANLTTDNIERIEIVRGPSSVLYGSDAVAGVIQIFTRRGRGPARGSLAARGGSFGTREGEGGLGGSFGAGDYSLGVANRRTDGILPFNNDYRNTTLSGQLGLGRPGSGEVRLAARYTDATFHYPTDGNGQLVDSNAVRGERRTVVSLDAGREVTRRLAVRLLAGTTVQDASSSNRPDGPSDTTRFYSEDHARTERRSADLRAIVRVDSRTSVTVGAEALRDQVHADGTSWFATGAPSSSAARQHRSSLGYYAQALRTAEKGLIGSLSARIDDNSKFGTFTTGRAALGYRFVDGTRVRGAIGNAFKAPAFDEIFSGAYVVGNAALRPEKSTSWEIGVERAFASGRLELSGTFFDQHYRDLIQYISGSASTGWRGTYDNLAAATASGVELALRAPVLGRFDVGVNYTGLRTRVARAGTGAAGTFVEGERLLRRPAHSGSVDVGYRPAQGAVIRATVLAVGERDDRDFDAQQRVHLPAYARLDLAGEYSLRALGPDWLTLTARAENVLGARYEQVYHFRSPGAMLLVGARATVGR